MSSVTKSDHPVVLLWDVKADDLKLLMNFMYEGQVNVAQEHLTNFLALAERLQVRGLTSTDNNKNGATAASAGGPNLQQQQQQQQQQMPNTMQNSRTACGVTPVKAANASPISGRRLRSSPMGLSSGLPASKRLRPSHLPTLEDSSASATADDIDDLPPPPPVKQELKVDENSVFTGPNAGPNASSSPFAGASSSFSPYFGATNAGEGFDSNAGSSSLPDGYGLEPGQMIEEGSKGRKSFLSFKNLTLLLLELVCRKQVL